LAFWGPCDGADRYYYFHNTGLQAQYVLYTQATLEGEARVLLDPNTLSTDGTVALGRQKFSDDGKLMAFELSTGGSDWKTVQVLRVEVSVGTAPLLAFLRRYYLSPLPSYDVIWWIEMLIMLL
jgi:prolyl oligopeptidase